MLYVRGCRSGEVEELDDASRRIIRVLHRGPLRFNQLRVLIGFHQYALSRRLRVLQTYCIVKKVGNKYYLCEDFVKRFI